MTALTLQYLASFLVCQASSGKPSTPGFRQAVGLPWAQKGPVGPQVTAAKRRRAHFHYKPQDQK